MYHFGPRRCVLPRLPALNKTAIRPKRWFQSFGRSTSMQNEIWLRTKRSAGLMPTEARGNYFPDPPYLRETKTYHSQPVDSIRHAGNYFVPLSIGLRPIFIFFCCRSYVKLLDYWRAEKNFSTSGGPLRPEARGICHICLHMVNPPLTIDTTQLMLVLLSLLINDADKLLSSGLPVMSCITHYGGGVA